MSARSKKLFAVTATLLGGSCLAVALINPARGTDDVNERLQKIVAAQVRGATSSFELSPMDMATIRPAALVERLRVTGEVSPSRHAVLRARTGGRIVHADIREGQTVRAGDVLVRLAPEDLQAALKEKEAGREGAMAEMVLAMQSLNRIEQLVSRRVASQEQLDKARSEVAARKARLDGLDAQVEVGQKALQDTQIIAPFDGIVSKVMVNQGTQVAPDAELLTLVDVADMEARVLISTQDVSRVAAGQFVELQIHGFKNQPIKGEVARISPVVDEGSRSVAIHIRLPDDGYRFKGGMFIHGSVLVRQAEDAIAVPVAALRRDQQEVYVLKLLDGVLVRQPVTIISQWEDEMAEVSGLAPGDMIVRSPLSELRPGLPVIVAQVG